MRRIGSTTGNGEWNDGIRYDNVPAVDLLGEYESIREEIDAAMQRALSSGWYILGNEVAAFEEEFAAVSLARGRRTGWLRGRGFWHGCTATCTDGLRCGPGDEVITVAHTAVATATAITLTGATPVFVDIDPTTYTMDAGRLEAAITPRRPKP